MFVRELKYCCPPETFGNFSIAACSVGQDRRDVRTDLAEDRAHDAFFLLEHRREKMFGLDLLILILLGNADRFLNGFLAADCKSVESHNILL